MKITEEQRKVLDSFSCERLAGKPENMWIVEDFYNSRNPQLEQNLKDKAYEEDENNTTAYYVIKDEEGSVVFYFSLKCGMLYEQNRAPVHISKPRIDPQIEALLSQ